MGLLVSGGDNWAGRLAPFTIVSLVVFCLACGGEGESTSGGSEGSTTETPAASTGTAGKPSPEPGERRPDADEMELALAEGLLDPELHVTIRVWAAEELGTAKNPRAVELLATALSDSEPDVVLAAVESLGKRSEPEAREALQSAQAHSDPRVTRRVAELLAQ